LEPLLPETKCIATKALLDAFPTDAATKAQLAAFRASVPYDAQSIGDGGFSKVF